MNKQNKYFMLLDDYSDKTERVIELLNSKRFSYTKQITPDLEVRLIISHIGWRSNWKLENVETACNYLLENINQNKVKYELKGGISNGPDFQKKGERYFNFTCYISDCETIIENSLSEEECFNKFLELSKKKSTEICKARLLHLFLPLDIDMQALEMIQNDPEKVNKYLLGDKDRDIEGMFEGREGDEHYRQKLYDLWHLLGKQDYLGQIGKNASSEVEICTPIDNSSPLLQKLAGLDDYDPKESPVYNFLESLDTRKKDDMDVTAEDLCKPFNLEIEVNGKKEEIKSFHNWYCVLASCLRDAEGCEGK